MSDLQDREWTLWDSQRCPNERGEYRFRATFPFLGMTVTAEWTEELHLCGMGYGDSEWWPLRSCYWDGYKRYITVKGLEWSPVTAYDPKGVVWHGLDLLPCPFTGAQPTIEPVGQFIGAPLWRSEAAYIGSPGVPQRRWTNAKAMVSAWNTRTPDPRITQLEAEKAELVERLHMAENRLERYRPHDDIEACQAFPEDRTPEDAALLWERNMIRATLSRITGGCDE